MEETGQRKRLTLSGILFGLGLGGFFDGIVLHQILQWHHMLSDTGEHPVDTVAGLEVNTLWDGYFHAATYVMVLLGLIVLWWVLRNRPIHWSTIGFIGAMLIGWGLFNLVEGIVDHHLLGIHHVNETVPESEWIYWDLGFLAWGALMVVVGWLLRRAGWGGAPSGAEPEHLT